MVSRPEEGEYDLEGGVVEGTSGAFVASKAMAACRTAMNASAVDGEGRLMRAVVINGGWG